MNPNKITAAVSSVTCVPVDDILGKRRHKPIALARQVTMYYIYKAGLGVVDTGEMFNCHHSNVSHAVKSVTAWKECDWEVRQITSKVEDAIPELKRVHNIDYQI